jgi:hypothetical protein
VQERCGQGRDQQRTCEGRDLETVTLPSREASSPAWTTSRGEISGKNRGMPAAAIGSVTDEG